MTWSIRISLFPNSQPPEINDKKALLSYKWYQLYLLRWKLLVVPESALPLHFSSSRSGFESGDPFPSPCVFVCEGCIHKSEIEEELLLHRFLLKLNYSKHENSISIWSRIKTTNCCCCCKSVSFKWRISTKCGGEGRLSNLCPNQRSKFPTRDARYI